MVRSALVFVHGLFSSPETWSDVEFLCDSDPLIAEFDLLQYSYWSPKISFNRLRRIPDFDVLARSFGTFLKLRAREYDKVMIVSHSQGGLIVQRYLGQTVASGQLLELKQIAGVVMFACPNSGSELAMLFRQVLGVWRHPQERQLRPLNAAVAETHAIVLERIVYAPAADPNSVHIPFAVYAGEYDNIVSPSSARGAFPHSQVGVLPGDHSSIIRGRQPEAAAFLAIKLHVRTVTEAQNTQLLSSAKLSDALQTMPESSRPLLGLDMNTSRRRPPTHNLPTRGLFLGRTDELTRLFQGIESPYGVVAVEGLGGMGKSALALEAAWQVASQSEMPDSAFKYVVWCGPSHSTITLDQIIDEVARTIDYPYIRSLPIIEKEQALLRALESCRSLIIIDNLETITDPLVLDLVRKLPMHGCKVLITSRRRYTEECWSVHLEGVDVPTGLELIGAEGQRLNLPELTTGEPQLLRRLYDVTGGNPLAVRLACGQIHDEGTLLEDILKQLEVTSIDGIFETIFQKSWLDGLSSDLYVKQILSAIVLHPGGASRDALSAAIGLQDSTLRSAVRRAVSLSVIDPRQIGVHRTLRYEMHPITRSFVWHELDRDVHLKNLLENRLVNYYCGYATRYADPFISEENVRLLDAERVNMLTFADLAFQQAMTDPTGRYWRHVLDFAEATAAFLWGRGYWRDRLRLCERALVAARALDDHHALARMNVLIGRVHLWLGDSEKANNYLKQAQIAIPDGVSDVSRVPTRRLEAQIATKAGDTETATRLLEDILAVAANTPDDDGRSATLIELGIVAHREGDFRTAQVRFEEALIIDEDLGTVEGCAVSLSHLANALLELGEQERAQTCFERGMRLAIRVDRLSTQGRCQLGLARVLAVRGDAASATLAAAGAEDAFLRLGMREMTEEAQLVRANLGQPLSSHQTENYEDLQMLTLSERAVIFDCDDTIIATARLRWSVLISTAATFGEELKEETIRRAWGKPFNELIKALVPTIAFEEFVRSYRVALRGVRPEPTEGATDLLENLKSRGAHMEIVTSSSRSLIEQDLDALKLTGYFLNIYGYEETEFHKPDPRALLEPIEALKARGFTPTEMVYIGDSVRDYLATEGHGIGFVGVLSGFDTRQDFESAGLDPARIVDTLSQIALDRGYGDAKRGQS